MARRALAERARSGHLVDVTTDEQGRRDSNPQPPVLETGALPIEPLPSAGILTTPRGRRPRGSPDSNRRQEARETRLRRVLDATRIAPAAPAAVAAAIPPKYATL